MRSPSGTNAERQQDYSSMVVSLGQHVGLHMSSYTGPLVIAPGRQRHKSGSNQGPITVSQSSLGSKMGCRCRRFSISYELVFSFDGGNKGSNPVGDAKFFNHLQQLILSKHVLEAPWKRTLLWSQSNYDSFFLASGTAYAAGGLCELAVDALR